MVWIKPTRWPRQPLALKCQLSTNPRPLLGFAHNGAAHLGQGPIVGMPDTCRGKAIVRLKVQVEHWRMGILAAGMREMNADVCLEWTFVRREAGVTVDTK